MSRRGKLPARRRNGLAGDTGLARRLRGFARPPLLLANVGELEAKLLEGVWIIGAPRCIQNFDANDSTFIVVVDDDAVRDFGAVFDRPVGQIKINRIGGVIDSYTHGLVLSK